MTENEELMWLGMATGLSTVVMLVIVAWWRRDVAPAGDQVTVLLSPPNLAAQAVPAVFWVLLGLAISIGVPIAAAEWDGRPVAKFAGLLFAAAALPMSVAPAVIFGERAVKRAAPGTATLHGSTLTMEYGPQSREIDLSGALVVIGWGQPLRGLGALVLHIDDRIPGPDGHTGAARLVVEIPDASGLTFVEGLGKPDAGWTMPAQGVPILGFDAAVQAFVERVLDAAQEVRHLGIGTES